MCLSPADSRYLPLRSNDSADNATERPIYNFNMVKLQINLIKYIIFKYTETILRKYAGDSWKYFFLRKTQELFLD